MSAKPKDQSVKLLGVLARARSRIATFTVDLDKGMDVPAAHAVVGRMDTTVTLELPPIATATAGSVSIRISLAMG